MYKFVLFIVMLLTFNNLALANDEFTYYQKEDMEAIMINKDLNLKSIDFLDKNTTYDTLLKTQKRDYNYSGYKYCFIVIEKETNKDIKHTCVSDDLGDSDIEFDGNIEHLEQVNLNGKSLEGFSIEITNAIQPKIDLAYSDKEEGTDYIYVFYMFNSESSKVSFGKIYQNF